MNRLSPALFAALAACSGSQNTTPDASLVPAADAAPDAEPAIDADARPDAALELTVGINEVLKNSPGPDDDHEFIEVFAPPSTDLSDHFLLVVEGDANSGNTVGSVEMLIQAGVTDENGLWVTPFFGDELPNGSFTLMLVKGIDAEQLQVDTDLDADDDGALDMALWTETVDALALVDDAEDTGYADVLLTDNADGFDDEFVGAARFPDGSTDGALSGWVRSNDEGDGLQGIPGFSGNTCASCGEVAAPSGQALLTPGASNQLAL
jgi:hypothetical protein